MTVTLNIALGHSRALSANYRTANPNARQADVQDFVADEMVKFLRAHDARGVDTGADFWYDEAINY